LSVTKRYFLSVLIVLMATPLFPSTKEHKYAVITVSAANIREKPTTKAAVLTIGRYGFRYPLLEDLGPWLKIKLPDGRTGFVYSPLARIEGEKVIIKKVAVPSKPPKAQPKPIGPLPTTAEGKFNLGKKLYYQDRYKEAIQVLEKALVDASAIVNEGKRRQVSGDAYFFMGLSYLGLKDYSRAKEAFKKTLRLVPDYSLNVTPEKYGDEVILWWKRAEKEVEREIMEGK